MYGTPIQSPWSAPTHPRMPSRPTFRLSRGFAVRNGVICAAVPSMAPLVALLPLDPALDDEAAAAAAAGLPVCRFTCVHAVDGADVELQWEGDSTLHGCTPATALFRGFMMSGERYNAFHAACAARGLRLLTTPAQYELVHYYPNCHTVLQEFCGCPAATWVSVPDPTAVVASDFDGAAAVAASWGCTHVVVKDFVKSAKHVLPGCLAVPVAVGGRVVQAAACDVARARALRFNKGIVLKQRVDLSDENNEWRLWLANRRLLSMCPNSAPPDVLGMTGGGGWSVTVGQRPPPPCVVAAAEAAAAALNVPFMTVDFAAAASSASTGTITDPATGAKWVCLEAGCGSVSGPAVGQDLRSFWAQLAAEFGGRTWSSQAGTALGSSKAIVL